METTQILSKPPAQLMTPTKQKSSSQVGFLRGARKTLPTNPAASHLTAGSPGHHRPRLARVSAVTQTRKLTLMTSRDLFGSACCPQEGAPLLSSLRQALPSPVHTCPCPTSTPWTGWRDFTMLTKPNTGYTTVSSRTEGGTPLRSAAAQSSCVRCRH